MQILVCGLLFILWDDQVCWSLQRIVLPFTPMSDYLNTFDLIPIAAYLLTLSAVGI